MKKEIRLYNVMFPIWFFWLLPTPLWLIILPVNFAVDSLVLCFAMKLRGLQDKLQIWKKSIWKIWAIGFFSDVVGALLILGLYELLGEVFKVRWNLILFPGTTLLSLPGVALGGVLIYFLNKRFSFGKCGLDAAAVRKLSLALAIFTAPYAMLIPIYG